MRETERHRNRDIETERYRRRDTETQRQRERQTARQRHGGKEKQVERMIGAVRRKRFDCLTDSFYFPLLYPTLVGSGITITSPSTSGL